MPTAAGGRVAGAHHHDGPDADQRLAGRGHGHVALLHLEDFGAAEVAHDDGAHHDSTPTLVTAGSRCGRTRGRGTRCGTRIVGSVSTPTQVPSAISAVIPGPNPATMPRRPTGGVERSNVWRSVSSTT